MQLSHLSADRMLLRIAFIFIVLCLLLGDIVAQQPTASRNDDFLNTIGVVGHIASNITVYLDARGVASDVQYIGARKFREALNADQSWQIVVLQALAKNGVKILAIPPNTGLSNTSYPLVITDLLKTAKTWNSFAPNALYVIEGPNEPVNFPITYAGLQGGGPNGSFIPVANFQRDWYAAIKADPILKDIPVWSVTQPGGQNENVGLQFLTIPGSSGAIFPAGTTYADGLNLHVYTVFENSPATVAGISYYDVALGKDFVTTYRKQYSGYTLTQAKALPKGITEFGYHTGGGPGPAVDLPTQAKNISTGLFNAFVQGYSVTCIYDLYDIGDGFGIFSKTGTPRTTGTYLHNLTTIMNDPGTNAAMFTPESLKFSLSGLPTTAMYQLFQKSDGHFQLVIWNNVNNYNLTTQQPISIAPVNVTISLDTFRADMQVFDPTVGTFATNSSINTTSATVALADYPLIIDILPRSASSATNIDNSATRKVEIYPNPLTIRFDVVFSAESEIRDAKISIYDCSGKEIKKVPITSHLTTIDRADIKSGVYFYRVVNNKKTVFGKLIVMDQF